MACRPNKWEFCYSKNNTILNPSENGFSNPYTKILIFIQDHWQSGSYKILKIAFSSLFYTFFIEKKINQSKSEKNSCLAHNRLLIYILLFSLKKGAWTPRKDSGNFLRPSEIKNLGPSRQFLRYLKRQNLRQFLGPNFR